MKSKESSDRYEGTSYRAFGITTKWIKKHRNVFGYAPHVHATFLYLHYFRSHPSINISTCWPLEILVITIYKESQRTILCSPVRPRPVSTNCSSLCHLLETKTELLKTANNVSSDTVANDCKHTHRRHLCFEDPSQEPFGNFV